MKRLLEEIYYGNLNPNAKRFIKDSQFDKAMQTLAENEEILTKRLEGKEKALFLDFVNAYGEMNGITAVEHFIEGFRLGSKLMLETLNGENDCFRPM